MAGFPNSPEIGDVHTIGSITWEWNGTAWIVKTGGSINISLDDLTDVIVSDAQQDEILKYNGSAWINTPTLDGGNFS